MEEHEKFGGGEMMAMSRFSSVSENDYILTEILLHLRTKIKIQCKIVCKRWLRLISSSYFAKRVLDREQNTVSIAGQNPPWELLYKYRFIGGEDTVTGEHLGLHVAFERIPELTTQRFKLGFLLNDEKIELIAAENGLILCGKAVGACVNDKHIEYYVCNPITGKWVSLPKPEDHEVVLVGFTVTCNHGNTKFKVVRLIHQKKLGTYNFEIFSSDDGQWRDTGVTYPDGKSCWNSGAALRPIGVVYNGILHWTTDTRLIAYDPDKNRCRLIGLDKTLTPPKIGLSKILGTSCGRLFYLSVGLTHPVFDLLSVWVLDNYDSEEWRPVLVTNLSSLLDVNDIPRAGFYLKPLAIDPFDMHTVYCETRSPPFDGARKIVSLNLQTQKLYCFTRDVEIPYGCLVQLSIFPFVLPPWPTLVPHPIWETT